MGMGLASESYLRISNLRECYRVVSRRKPYEISMLKAQEYDVSLYKEHFLQPTNSPARQPVTCRKVSVMSGKVTLGEIP